MKRQALENQNACSVPRISEQSALRVGSVRITRPACYQYCWPEQRPSEEIDAAPHASSSLFAPAASVKCSVHRVTNCATRCVTLRISSRVQVKVRAATLHSRFITQSADAHPLRHRQLLRDPRCGRPARLRLLPAWSSHLCRSTAMGN